MSFNAKACAARLHFPYGGMRTLVETCGGQSDILGAIFVSDLPQYFRQINELQMKHFLKKIVAKTGYEIRRQQPIHGLEGFELFNVLRNDPIQDGELQKFLRFVLQNLRHTKSQIFQDLFVLFALDHKRDGYFVEFGAADGDFLSNTVLLEQQYGWRGIVAEPSRNWHKALRANRKCDIDLRCVWSETGRSLRFSQAPDPLLSTVSEFKGRDGHNRSGSKDYSVETVSLNDLLEQHNAPQVIDYLSIDTEGSELTILKSFDFNNRSFRAITVEHNYNRLRDDIFSLLISKGYKRIFENVTMWDDWYVTT
jgi:FkbM family methyltransferase